MSQPAPDAAQRAQLARDLRWVAEGPDLLSAEALGATLAPLLRPPVSLPGRGLRSQFSKPFRLGPYFEELVAWLVREQYQPSHLELGRQLYHQGRSIGELDLCFALPDGNHHWELACKFYLYQPGSGPPQLDEFLGPRRADRLDKKCQRLRHRQLTLPRRPEAQTCLPDWPDLQTAALIRGRMFYPCDRDWRNGTSAPQLQPDHLRGWWAMPEMRSQLPAAHSWRSLPRTLWLATTEADLAPAVDPADIWPAAPGDAPELVAGFAADGSEVHRGFLLPPGWDSDPHDNAG